MKNSYHGQIRIVKQNISNTAFTDIELFALFNQNFNTSVWWLYEPLVPTLSISQANAYAAMRIDREFVAHVTRF